MKKSLILLITLLTLQTLTVKSQAVQTPPRPVYGPAFIRIYPLELIMHEVRMGVELPTTHRQAIVVDGSYFLRSTTNTTFQEGWALKMDYRFYLADPREHFRIFVGPNLMVKGQQYQKKVYNLSSGPTYTTVPRMIYCGNLKMGVDILLSKEGRTRLELFSGAGLRYQSIGKDFSFDFITFSDTPNSTSPTTYSYGKIVPNILLGALLKF